MIDKKNVLNAVMILENFLNSVPGGESYWIDDEGKEHTADLGYVNEFLIDLKEYTTDALEEQAIAQEPVPDNYKVYISHKFIPVVEEFYCSDYYLDSTKKVLVFKTTAKENKVNLYALNAIKITSIKTGAVLYQYPPSICPYNC